MHNLQKANVPTKNRTKMTKTKNYQKNRRGRKNKRTKATRTGDRETKED